jgi:hypothetical protein
MERLFGRKEFPGSNGWGGLMSSAARMEHDADYSNPDAVKMYLAHLADDSTAELAHKTNEFEAALVQRGINRKDESTPYHLIETAVLNRLDVNHTEPKQWQNQFDEMGQHGLWQHVRPVRFFEHVPETLTVGKVFFPKLGKHTQKPSEFIVYQRQVKDLFGVCQAEAQNEDWLKPRLPIIRNRVEALFYHDTTQQLIQFADMYKSPISNGQKLVAVEAAKAVGALKASSETGLVPLSLSHIGFTSFRKMLLGLFGIEEENS